MKKFSLNNDRARDSILDLVVVTLGLFVSRAFMFAISIIIARTADAQTFGQFALFTTIFLIASEVPNAIDTTYIRFCNKAKGLDERHRLFVADLLLKIIIGFVFIIAGLFFSPIIAVHIFNKPESIELIQVSILSGSLYSIYLAFVAYHQQKKNFSVLAVMRGMLNLSMLVVLSAMVFIDLEFEIYDIAAIYVVIILLMIAITVVVNLDNIKSNVFFDKRILKKFIEVSGLLIIASFITLVSNRLDVFFIASLLDYESLGLYNVAVRVSLILAIVSGSIRTIVLPSAANAVHDKASYYKYLKTSSVYISLLVLSATLIIILHEPIILYTFGSAYIGAGDVVVILLLQAVLNGTAVPFVALMQCGPHPRYTILLSIVKMVVGVVSLSILVPLYGIYGASMGVTLATTIALILAVFISTISRPVS